MDSYISTIDSYINEINDITNDLNLLNSIFIEFNNNIEVDDNENTYFENDIFDLLELIDLYINDNPTLISEPDFDDILLEDMSIFCENEELLECTIELFHLLIFPKRSGLSNLEIIEDTLEIKTQIDFLKLHPQHIQRSKEWYNFRNNLITASNAYKIFETNAMKNQLIYEKCNINSETDDNNTSIYVNVSSTLHWGQKYEPLSKLIYEQTYNTVIEDFGCIKHPKYDFLGASPDGINTDKSSVLYGRMLEIKNIVNREIDGIPKKEYWIQMQIQMEVCNLNKCDFLETKFIEYETETEFKNDYNIDEPLSYFTKTNSSNIKGIIMYFSTQEGIPKYIYKKLDMNESEFEIFENIQIKEMELNNIIWIKNIYWKLEIFSCVVVERNHIWFNSNILEIYNIWNTILIERKTGYQHRSPKKRNNKNKPINECGFNKCMLQINNGKTNII